MSIELVLIPIALAAVSAAKAARLGSPTDGDRVEVQSRLKDTRLLTAALADLGATIMWKADDSLAATLPQGELMLSRTGEAPWVAHFGDGWSQQAAVELIGQLDVAYGLHVQQTVLARLRERAPTAGMTVESERVEDDQTVTMMLRLDA